MECRHGLSVCLSVCLSNACIVTKRKKDLSRFLYHTKVHLAYFSKKKNGWWNATPYTWNSGSTGPRWSEIADFERRFARSASAVTPSKKVQLTLIGSRIRAFDWYRRRWPSLTLNNVIAFILRFFPPNSIALQADYVTVFEDRPIMSIKYCLPVLVFHFWPKPTHPAARSLCDNWACCILLSLFDFESCHKSP